MTDSTRQRRVRANIVDTPSRVRLAYSSALANGEVTEAQLNKVLWLVQIANEAGDSRNSLAQKLNVSTSTVSRLYSGTYGAKLDQVLSRIDDYRRLYDERRVIKQGIFIETSLVKSIWQICDTARAYSMIIPIYGDSQTGKSFALEEYAHRNNHGMTIYLRMPSGGHLTHFLEELNKALGEVQTGSNRQLRKPPMSILNKDKLLIIDEFTQAFFQLSSATIRLQTIEYIRELHDVTGCGIILCGTNGVKDAIEKGRHKGVLEQTRRRALTVLQLPSMLPRSDMDLIAHSYDLPDADDTLHELRVKIIKSTGLKAYTSFLKAGSAIAAKHGETYTWRHFTRAHDILAKLSASDSKAA